MIYIITIFILLTLLLNLNSEYIDIKFDVNQDGDFIIGVRVTPLLISSSYYIYANNKKYSTADNTLVLNNTYQVTDYDPLGKYYEYAFVYNLIDTDSNVIFSMKIYNQTNGAIESIIFKQYFPDTLTGCSTGNADILVSNFPSFNIQDFSDDAGFAHWVSWYYGPDHPTYNKTDTKSNSKYSLPAPGFISPVTGLFNNQTSMPGGVAGSGTTCFFSKSHDFAYVFSPFDNVMPLSNLSPEPGVIENGLMGNVSTIVAGSSYTFILTSGRNLSDAMSNFGTLLRNFNSKPESKISRVDDLTLNYLGYSTDNGAYYYYNTVPGMDYQDTILAVKKYADSENIPYKYILLDSYWYYRGVNNGVKDWVPQTELFPNGFAWLYNQTNWFVQAHNRYWSIDNVYAMQNGGKYNFIADTFGRGMIPNDPQFWDDLFADSASWGLKVYEQDWLNQQIYDFAEALMTDPLLAPTWLEQMNAAASRANLKIQYCMPNIRHLLQSVKESSVTQARASDDYNFYRVAGYENWRIGGQSIIMQAVGLAPSKDGMWTSTFQPGNPYSDSVGEPYPRMESAIATLSTGPVQIDDKIGSSDVSLIMKTCTMSGKLLHPDVPAKMIDRAIYARALNNGDITGEIWASNSIVSGLTYGYLIAADISVGGTLNLADMNLNSINVQNNYYYFEANSTSTVLPFTDGSVPIPVLPLTSGFLLYTAFPLLYNSWGFMGETDKWVSVSSYRFSSISVIPAGLLVVANGSVNEVINVSFFDQTLKTIVPVSCTVGESGVVSIGSDGKCF